MYFRRYGSCDVGLYVGLIQYCLDKVKPKGQKTVIKAIKEDASSRAGRYNF